MKTAWVSKYAKRLYTDRMNVYGHTGAVGADGTTSITRNTTPTYTAAECRISFEGEDSAGGMTESSNPISLSPKIFCAPTITLPAGAYIVLERKGDDGSTIATYRGTVGLANVYPSHQEILFIQESDA